MVQCKPKEGFYSKAVRLSFENLKSSNWSDPKFRAAVEFARRSYENIDNFDETEEPSKKRFRASGGGRKVHAPEMRDSLFEWFIGK